MRTFVHAAALALAGATVSLVAPAQAQTFEVGPQTSTLSGLARGYYFTAPTSFTITSLYVANTASSGNQWAQVVKLGAVPASYPTLTNNFTSLGYFANQSGATPISTSINVAAGDIIGILGTRGLESVNSYGSATSNSIFGLPVTISRLGFQDTLNAGPAHDLFVEPTSTNYSRVNFTYALLTSAAPEPGTWALMILGFGAAGVAMRRSRKKVTVRYA